MGELWSVCCECFREKCPCYNEVPLYFLTGSVSVREKHLVELEETKELEDYRRDLAWLDECYKDFNIWYNACEKVAQPERKVCGVALNTQMPKQNGWHFAVW